MKNSIRVKFSQQDLKQPIEELKIKTEKKASKVLDAYFKKAQKTAINDIKAYQTMTGKLESSVTSVIYDSKNTKVFENKAPQNLKNDVYNVFKRKYESYAEIKADFDYFMNTASLYMQNILTQNAVTIKGALYAAMPYGREVEMNHAGGVLTGAINSKELYDFLKKQLSGDD